MGPAQHLQPQGKMLHLPKGQNPCSRLEDIHLLLEYQTVLQCKHPNSPAENIVLADGARVKLHCRTNMIMPWHCWARMNGCAKKLSNQICNLLSHLCKAFEKNKENNGPIFGLKLPFRTTLVRYMYFQMLLNGLIPDAIECNGMECLLWSCLPIFSNVLQFLFTKYLSGLH